MRNSGRLIGFAAVSALTLIPLAVAAPAWADDEVSGETGAAVATPVGSGEFNTASGTEAGFGGAGFDSNTGAAINTPLGGSSFNTGAATDFNVPNPADFIPTFGGGANAGGGAAVSTPVGGSGFNTGSAGEVGPNGVQAGSNSGAGVATPVGGSNFGSGSAFTFGR